jgi:site-specific DNA-methyltransferase (adenine-specific)
LSEDWINKLYFSDNLKILKEEIADESVDLIYLDPPFNSQATYNVLFEETGGEKSTAQITAFEDTWRWGMETEKAYQDLVSGRAVKLAKLLESFRTFLGQNDMMVYLTMMAPRLVELHRVLKPTGSIYLHCDPTASHYLKLLMDAIFKPENFRSEIIWRRSNAHNKITRQYGPIHDTILFFSKSDDFVFHPGVRPYTLEYIRARFTQSDQWGFYQLNYLTGLGTRSGESGKPWQGFDPTSVGRHWAIPRSLRRFLANSGLGMTSQEQLEVLFIKGFIVFPKKEGGQPMYKQYIGKGVPYQDIWAYQPNTKGTLYNIEECIDEDVKYLEDEDEKLGFATQKPLGLLARIIQTSSDEGNVVLDPFCGCGTAVVAAEALNRKWIGIDITHLAIALIKNRLGGEQIKDRKPYRVFGIPRDAKSAEALAIQNRHQFEWWAVGLVGGRPAQDKRKGADRGVDGYIYFFDDGSDKAKKIVIQVKSGSVSSEMIRDLRGTMEREKAVIASFITLKPPTRDMRKEAASSGIYQPEFYPQFRYNRIQVLTIEELLAGKNLEYPRVAPDGTFGRKPKRRRKSPPQVLLI